MDGALACERYSIIVVTRCSNEWEGMGVCYEALGVKQLLVQILVVVANIQMRALKTEVEKGFMWTAVGHGLVDP